MALHAPCEETTCTHLYPAEEAASNSSGSIYALLEPILWKCASDWPFSSSVPSSLAASPPAKSKQAFPPSLPKASSLCCACGHAAALPLLAIFFFSASLPAQRTLESTLAHRACTLC